MTLWTAEPASNGAPSDGSVVSQLLALAGGSNRMTRRTKRVLTAYAVATAVYPRAKTMYARVATHFQHVVAMYDDDPLYPDVQAWLLTQVPSHKLQSLHVRSDAPVSHDDAIFASDVPAGGRGASSSSSFSVAYDGQRQQVVHLDGHRIIVNISRDAPTSSMSGSGGGSSPSARSVRGYTSVRFTARNTAGRDAVLSHLRGLAASRTSVERLPRFYVANSWGHWDRRDDLVRRSVDSVVLASGVREQLYDDLVKFLAQEQQYLDAGIPYHRGYLLHGPPGTGKTSMIKAVASALGLDLYWIPLADMREDASLLEIISRVSPGSVLLLEDVDIVQSAVSRGGGEVTSSPPPQAFGVTLSGLLNALDGVATPHGLVTMMTTNFVDTLDAALTRDGRMDQRILVDYLDDDQYVRLVKRLAGVDITGAHLTRQTTPAEVVGVIKKHIGEPDVIARELAKADWHAVHAR